MLRVHFSAHCLSQPITNLSPCTPCALSPKGFFSSKPCSSTPSSCPRGDPSDCKSSSAPSAGPSSHTLCWTTASHWVHLCVPATSSGKTSLTTPTPRSLCKTLSLYSILPFVALNPPEKLRLLFLVCFSLPPYQKFCRGQGLSLTCLLLCHLDLNLLDDRI